MNLNRPDMTETVKSENYTNKPLQKASNPTTMEAVTQTNAVKSLSDESGFHLSESKCMVSARFLHGFKTCKGCKSLQNRTKGAETPSSKLAMYRKETTLKRNFQKLRKSPGVRYESVGRGFESLPSHQEKPEHVCVLVFLFVSTMEGARTGRRRAAPQAISPVQQRRPQPAAETGRSCWGRVLIFQSPAKGLRKNQLTQPVAVA